MIPISSILKILLHLLTWVWHSAGHCKILYKDEQNTSNKGFKTHAKFSLIKVKVGVLVDIKFLIVLFGFKGGKDFVVFVK